MKHFFPFFCSKKSITGRLPLYCVLLLVFCPFLLHAQTLNTVKTETHPFHENTPQNSHTEQSVNQKPNPNKIADLAHLLTAEEIKELSILANAFINRHNMDLVLCTTTDTGGKSSMKFADDYFDYNGYGIGADLSGILLLLDMDNRQVYVSTAGSAIEKINDTEVEKILDALVSHVSDNPYRSFLAGIRAAEKALGAAVLPVFLLPQPKMLLFFLLIALLAGTISVIIVLVLYRAKRVKDTYPFNTNAKLDLTHQIDVFIGKNVIKQKIENSGSSGGGSSHTSGSGRSHGGGGRSF